MEGGHALADLLFGAANPAGRLPCTFPRSAEHLPFFDANAKAIRYDYFHGYWRLDRDGHAPAFPFGFGLSYTAFAYSDLALGAGAIGPEEALEVSVSVTNTGARAGAEVVQLYAGHLESAVERPIRALKGFQKIALEPGESRRVTLRLPARALAIYDTTARAWRVEPGRCRVEVGPYADGAVLLAGECAITDKREACLLIFLASETRTGIRAAIRDGAKNMIRMKLVRVTGGLTKRVTISSGVGG
jgi:beta-glucosidase